MHFLPGTSVCKKSNVEALVAVLLRCVDEVHHTSRTLLEIVGQGRIYLQGHSLLLTELITLAVHIINESDNMLYVDVIEVRAISLHLAPDTVRSAVADFRTNLQAVAGKTIDVLVSHFPDLFFVFLTIEIHLSGNELIVFRTAVLE